MSTISLEDPNTLPPNANEPDDEALAAVLVALADLKQRADALLKSPPVTEFVAAVATAAEAGLSQLQSWIRDNPEFVELLQNMADYKPGEDSSATDAVTRAGAPRQ